MHELVVKLSAPCFGTLQAQIDDIQLIRQAHVITAQGSGVTWSIRLDSEEQLMQLAEAVGIAPV